MTLWKVHYETHCNVLEWLRCRVDYDQLAWRCVFSKSRLVCLTFWTSFDVSFHKLAHLGPPVALLYLAQRFLLARVSFEGLIVLLSHDFSLDDFIVWDHHLAVVLDAVFFLVEDPPFE